MKLPSIRGLDNNSRQSGKSTRIEAYGFAVEMAQATEALLRSQSTLHHRTARAKRRGDSQTAIMTLIL
jgi:hypothetical protein